ncbi:putative LRR receptor-like serine/threonine-protein kinase [Platanthera zijinensis]|uniref:LRR receptor-like serine/threonine-protein kinase n=1 Tax=Platanthera zijinensis TaxID=2320716 RepID=A0AAP0G4X9_9ASPA
MPLPLLILTFVFLRLAAGLNINSTADLAALYSLRASLGLRARDWPRRADPCSAWTGVGCDADGRVISLNLLRPPPNSSRISASLSSFNASGFPLPGSIPPWFGLGNPGLAVLDLRHASISGEIPSSLAVTGLVVLSLSDNNLTGSIPPQLGDLSSLISLDLSSNLLLGPLPDTLKFLKNLQNLNLGSNFLTGFLDDNLFSSLSKLESVKLGHNNFSGLIPASLCSLSSLRFLDVSFNNFTGNLPHLSSSNLTRIGIALDLSHNLLYGSIPSNFALLLSRFNFVDISYNYLQDSVPFELSIRNLSILSNCFQNASSQRVPADCQVFYRTRGIEYDGVVNSPQIPLSNSPKHKRTWKYIVIAVVCGSALLVLFVMFIVFCIMKSRAHSAKKKMDVNAASVSAPSQITVKLPTIGTEFTYEQVAIATSGFSEENLIKHGHSGDLYHGVLEDGHLVVVKRIDVNNVKNEKYLVELDLFARSLHERLVMILGQCLQKENEKFIVYKEMLHRDLASALYRKPAGEDDGWRSLDWITRLKIATGVAEALCHLHYEFTPPLVHRDVQASSILLDDKFEVRLGSLSNVCAQEGDGHQNVISRFLRLSRSRTSDQNSSGLAPASCAYDVYCFGKVLLELVTGKLGISGSNGDSTTEWLEHTLSHIDINEKEPVTKIIDPSLVIYEDLLDEVWAMSIVARSCLNPKPSKRPLMKHIRRALENPLKVIREDSSSGSVRLRDSPSQVSWNAAFFGSWRHNSQEIAPATAVARRNVKPVTWAMSKLTRDPARDRESIFSSWKGLKIYSMGILPGFKGYPLSKGISEPQICII